MSPTVRYVPLHLGIALFTFLAAAVAGVDAAMAAPMVRVLRAGTAVPAGTTDDVGSIPVQAGHLVTYTLENAGDQELLVIDVGLLTPLNGGCSVSTSPGSPVAVGASTTFALTLRADAAGPAGCTIRIVSNEPQQLYSFTLRGTGAAGDPEIEVTSGSRIIPDGGVVDALGGTPGVPSTMAVTVKNVGTARLDVVLAEITSQMGATCTMASTAVFSVEPGGATNIAVEITRSGPEDFSCTLAIQSNDADEDPTLIELTSRIRGPHFRVFVNDVEVESVAAVDLGDPTKAIEPGLQTSHQIRVENVGTDDLFELFPTISGPCESATFPSRPVFRSGESASGIINLWPEPRGPLEGDICVIRISVSDSERRHFYVTILRHRRPPDRGCSSSHADGGWLAIGVCVLFAACRRSRRRVTP